MNTIGQISEINFKIGEIFISEWTLSLRLNFFLNKIFYYIFNNQNSLTTNYLGFDTIEINLVHNNVTLTFL